ncbi:MAG TPA: YraN family protein [Myxococcaceae bacterium]|nr:YraN family protein [Myxococcaceae bacterium]
MATERRATGDRAEALAASFLERDGYTVLARNYTCRVGELDLVASRGEVLAVVEVRMRSTDRFGDPALTISHAKQRKIVRTTLRFMQEHGLSLARYAIRFDVITVLGRGEQAVLEHLPGAFEAGM